MAIGPLATGACRQRAHYSTRWRPGYLIGQKPYVFGDALGCGTTEVAKPSLTGVRQGTTVRYPAAHPTEHAAEHGE